MMLSRRSCTFPSCWWSVRNFRWCIQKRCNSRNWRFIPIHCWCKLEGVVFFHLSAGKHPLFLTLCCIQVWLEVKACSSEFLVGIFHPAPVWVRFRCWLKNYSCLLYLVGCIKTPNSLSQAHGLKWKVPQRYPFAAFWWELHDVPL